jgi:hypothetical protein
MPAPEDEKPYQELLNTVREKWQASKAAFYVLDAQGQFRLKSQYGFSRTDRLPEKLSRLDILATSVYEHRTPFFVNSLSQAGKLADLMEGAATTRILTAPLYLDGRIVGILDVRDKANRVPFTHEDLQDIGALLQRLAVQLGRGQPGRPSGAIEEYLLKSDRPSGLTGAVKTVQAGRTGPIDAVKTVQAGRTGPIDTSAFRPVEGSGSRTRVPSAEFPTDRRTTAQAPAAEPAVELSPMQLPTPVARTIRLVEETMARAGVRPAPPPLAGLSLLENEFARTYLQLCLQFTEVEVAALSVFLPGMLEVSLASRRPVDPEVQPALIENLEKIFTRSGPPFAMPAGRTFKPVDLPVVSHRAVKRVEIGSIQSSVLFSGPEAAAVFSLLFRHGPTPEGREGLRSVHGVLKNAMADLRSEARYRDAYRGLVNKLIEPGLKRRSALKTHSFNVGRTARKLAGFLSLPPTEIEQITVAAILHDVGMSDLNYEELYQKRSLSVEEHQLFRLHPRVGAFMVEEIAWPYPIAPLIRHHHERWDGAGYPEGLRGAEIPLGARLIHLCEAFDAMTSPSSYRAVLTEHQALDILVSKAGTQFDPELASAFRRMVDGKLS